MPEKDAAKFPFNPFDLTKVWPHKDYPLIDVGVLELNRNPENYFAEVEQAAFNPANIVPGIGFSPDKMLQGRLFSYGDAQRYRLGVNHHLIPVNRARCPVHSYHRDGAMRVDGNHGGTLGYEPNSYGEWQEQPELPRAAARASRARPTTGATAKTMTTTTPSPGAVPADEPGAAEGALREHRPGHGRCAPGDQDPPHRQLPEGRSGLRRGRGQRAWASR